VLDEEKPDLVVLSGDQVNGDTAPDVQSVKNLLSQPCVYDADLTAGLVQDYRTAR